MQQLEQEIRHFVVDNFFFGEEKREFSNEASFFDTGVLDSMGVLTLVSFVQEKYAIRVDDKDLVPDNFDSVHRVARFVHSKLNGKG